MNKKSKPKKVKPLTPVYDEGRKSWRLSIPATLSPTGKRQRLFFESKKLAELEAMRIKGNSERWGTEGRSISATLAEDAARAAAILEKFDVTLTHIAKLYKEQKQLEAESKTFIEVWEERLNSLTACSDRYLQTVEQVGNKLLPIFKDTLVCNIKHDELRTALNKSYPTAHGFNTALRVIAPVFNLAVTEGWATENPCQRIQKKQTGRHEVKILTLSQCRKVMSSAIDYRQREDLPGFMRVDARGAIPTLALMLFCGIRPGGEITRLSWEDIDLQSGTVFVSNRKSKTDRSRHFTMPDTCKAWLELTPLTERTGSIVPSSWKKCWQAIRRNAGISDLQDGLRKTFASCHLQHFGDVKETRSILGHEQGDVLFTNYRGLIKPSDAAAFWQILPSGDAFEVVA